MSLKKPPQTIVICGAGIGGLTVAHELAKRSIHVTILERNETVGGLARSGYTHERGFSYPVEYSWRVYGTGYKNLLRILREIPLQENKNRSVYHRLKTVHSYLFPRVGKPALLFSPETEKNSKSPELSFTDNFRIFIKILSCITMSRERIASLDHLTWKEFCRDLTLEANNYLVKMWGPVLGMDPSKMSFAVVAPFVGILLSRYTGAASGVQLLDRPTNDGWFDEWTNYLVKTGCVAMRTSTEVEDIRVENGAVKSIVIQSKAGKTETLPVGLFVCGMGVEAMSWLIRKNSDLKKRQTFKDIVALSKVAHQIQLSIQLFLNEEILYPTSEPPILYLPDSPWALIIEPQDLVWGETYCSDPRVKSVLSVGICQTDAYGVLHKKSFVECTKKEVEEEVIAQMAGAYKNAPLRMKSGAKLGKKHIVKFHLWDSFSFDDETGRMTTWEPKFSNNAGGASLMPPIATEIRNLFFATGYTKTDRFIYSMESAAEAGTACANEILTKLGVQSKTPVYPFLFTPFFLRPIVALDRIFFHLRLPHFGKFAGGALVVFSILLLLFRVL